MSFKKVDSKTNFPKMEEEILKFWEEQKIFEKSGRDVRGEKDTNPQDEREISEIIKEGMYNR